MFQTIIYGLLWVAVGCIAETSVLTKKEIDQIKQRTAEQCQRFGDPTKTAAAQKGMLSAMKCFTKVIDFHEVEAELKAHKENHTLDDFLAKYCDKAPQFKECAYKLARGLSPCMEEPDQILPIPRYNKVIDQLTDFLCKDRGRVIADFLVYKGPECFKDLEKTLQGCVSRFTEAVGYRKSKQQTCDTNSLKEKCTAFRDVSTCFMDNLRTCESPIPSDIMESMFALIKKETNC